MSTSPSDPGPTTPEPVALDDERTIWLTRLYEANVRMVLKTCRRLLHSPEDAADATHEVFLRAAATLQAAPDGKDAAAWLTTVARNYCLDVLRRRRLFRSALTTLGSGVTPLESETKVVDRQLAQAVLEQLAVRERRALWESHVEQRPVGEIAERLGLSYSAAAQLLHRARRRAALVAAELAAILALVRSGLLRRRAVIQNMVQPVAAVVVIPLVAIALISTGSGAPSSYAAQAGVSKALHAESNQARPSPSDGTAGLLPSNPVSPPGVPPPGHGGLQSTNAKGQQTAPAVPVAPPPQAVLPLPNPVTTPVGSHHKKRHVKGRDHDDLVGDRVGPRL